MGSDWALWWVLGGGLGFDFIVGGGLVVDAVVVLGLWFWWLRVEVVDGGSYDSECGQRQWLGLQWVGCKKRERGRDEMENKKELKNSKEIIF